MFSKFNLEIANISKNSLKSMLRNCKNLVRRYPEDQEFIKLELVIRKQK